MDQWQFWLDKSLKVAWSVDKIKWSDTAHLTHVNMNLISMENDNYESRYLK